MIHRLLKRRTDDARTETIWLTVYSDLMTNLVLVFLALYGLVTMGQQSFHQAMESMKLVGVRETSDPDKTVLTLEEVAHLLRQEFKNDPDISIFEKSGVVRVEFGENVLFTSGEAQLKESAYPELRTIAHFLELLPYTIIVEGHTDDVPVLIGSPYKNNNELSMARAMSVVNELIDKQKIPPGQIAAAAYGPFRPRASNLTPSDRRFNRRVEIALFKEFPYEL